MRWISRFPAVLSPLPELLMGVRTVWLHGLMPRPGYVRAAAAVATTRWLGGAATQVHFVYSKHFTLGNVFKHFVLILFVDDGCGICPESSVT